MPSVSVSSDIPPGASDASSAIPKAALWLGASGFLPFVGLSLAAVLIADAQIRAQFGLLVYGAVILSFLGGIHWGLEMARQGREAGAPAFGRLGLSVLPSLLAWVGLAMPIALGSITLTAGFVLLLGYDLWSTKAGLTPKWYPKLRVPLTLAVCTAILLPNAF